MQGPFTSAHVGGNQHRHAPMNTGSDNPANRGEQFKIDAHDGYINIVPPHREAQEPTALNRHLARATFYRDGVAKAPIKY